MIYGNEDAVIVPCEIETVVERGFDRGTVTETASVYPYQNGFSDLTVYGFGPDVQVLAVFTLYPILMGNQKMIPCRRIEMKKGADTSVDRAVMDIVPFLRSMRRMESLCLRYLTPRTFPKVVSTMFSDLSKTNDLNIRIPPN